MRRYRSSDYLDMLLQIAPELKDGSGSAPAGLPSLRHVVWIDSSAQETDDPFDRCPRVQRFSQLLATGLVDDERLVQLSKSIQPVDSINIQFTSGTTGSPKGATLTHRNVVNNGFFVGDSASDRRMDRKSDYGSFRLGTGSPLSDPRSRSGLWQCLHPTTSINGHSRPTNVATLPVAKWICRTADRFDPTGMP